jgi:predicted permease
VIIQKTISSVAQTATPIALIVIGAGFEGRKAIKKIRPTLVGTAIKLVAQAAIFLPVAIWMGFRNQELMAILIMLASPSTVSCYIMAKNMDNDSVLSSSIIVLTTMLSSITLTAWIFLLRWYGFV